MRQISPPGSHHDEQEIEAIVELLRSSRLMIGENVAAFEEQVAPLMAKRHGVMVNSGTSAIYLALDLLDLQPGDEIITSVLTFSADMFTAGNPIDIELRGTDVDALRRVSAELQAALEGFPGVRDVRDSYRASKDELELRLRPSAEGLGLSVADLARQVRQAFFGEEAQRLARNGEDVKVMVRYPRESRRALGDVENLRIRTPEAQAIPLSVVADVRMGEGPAAIQRANGARVVNVQADVDIAVTSGQAVGIG